jgi:hypothetical protein
VRGGAGRSGAVPVASATVVERIETWVTNISPKTARRADPERLPSPVECGESCPRRSPDSTTRFRTQRVILAHLVVQLALRRSDRRERHATPTAKYSDFERMTVNRSRVRIGAGLVVLGAIPGLVSRSVSIANVPVVELGGGVLMLVGAAVLAVAWWQDVTTTEANAGDPNG